jgi:hypothetical protein
MRLFEPLRDMFVLGFSRFSSSGHCVRVFYHRTLPSLSSQSLEFLVILKASRALLDRQVDERYVELVSGDCDCWRFFWWDASECVLVVSRYGNTNPMFLLDQYGSRQQAKGEFGHFAWHQWHGVFSSERVIRYKCLIGWWIGGYLAVDGSQLAFRDVGDFASFVYVFEVYEEGAVCGC